MIGTPIIIDDTVTVNVSVETEAAGAAQEAAARAESAASEAESLRSEVSEDKLAVASDREAVELARSDVEEKAGIAEQAALDALEALSKVAQGDYRGLAAPSTNPGTPSTPVYYFAGESGTYTNFGGLTVTASEGINILSFNGSAWSKAVVPIDLAGYAKTDELEAAIEQIAAPGFFNTGQKKILFNSNQIYPEIGASGFGFSVGAIQNFKSLSVDIAATNPPSQARVQIREINRTGLIIADKVIEVNIPPSTRRLVVCELDELILNLDQKNLWIEWRFDTVVSIRVRNPAEFTEENGFARGRGNLGTPNINTQPLSFFDRDIYIEFDDWQEGIIPSEGLTRSTKLIAQHEVNIQRPVPSFVSFDGDELYISNKFDAENDLTIRFRKAMVNSLFTFQRVGLVANDKNNVDQSKIKDEPYPILTNVGSDNIGPVGIVGAQWIGGNHYNNEDGATITAETHSYKVFVDDMEFNEGEKFCSNVRIDVENHLFDPLLLPSVQDTLIVERVTYLVQGGNIEVTCHHEFLKSTTVSIYYGMQFLYNSLFQYIYYSNSQHLDRITYNNSTANDAGQSSTYPDVEAIIFSNNSKTICAAAILNRKRSLGMNLPGNISPSQPLAFKVSSGKAYFRLLENKEMQPGDSHYWNGTYAFFNQNYSEIPLSTNTVHMVRGLRESRPSLNAYFKGPSKQVSNFRRGKKIEMLDKSEDISFDEFSSRGVEITSSDNGFIILQG